jgi:small conductance mechanosensitive channel
VVALLIIASIAFRVVRPIVHRTLVRVFRQRPSETVDAEVTAAEAAKRAATIEDLLSTVLHFTIIVVTLLVLLTWFDLLPVIAGLGVIAAALTLAGQSIVLEGPYYKGDWIQVGAIEGEVEEIGLRRTILRDSSGTVHSVSNGAIRIASNLTRVYARMQVDMTVAFGTDLEMATRVVNEVGQAMAEDPAWKDRLLEVPAVSRVPALGDLGVTLRVAGKVRAADRWAAPSELRGRLIEAFVERGIDIAARGQVVADRPPGAGSAGAPVPAGSPEGGTPGGGILGGGNPGGV